MINVAELIDPVEDLMQSYRMSILADESNRVDIEDRRRGSESYPSDRGESPNGDQPSRYSPSPAHKVDEEDEYDGHSVYSDRGDSLASHGDGFEDGVVRNDRAHGGESDRVVERLYYHQGHAQHHYQNSRSQRESGCMVVYMGDR